MYFWKLTNLGQKKIDFLPKIAKFEMKNCKSNFNVKKTLVIYIAFALVVLNLPLFIP